MLMLKKFRRKKMEIIKTDGVVIKRTSVGDNDVILTVFTEKLGVIKASAKGVKSLKSRMAAGSALFTYAEFVLKQGKTMYSVSSCEPKESFYNLATNIERLSFATYIADLTGYTVREETPDGQLMSLLLNTLYLLANSQRDLRLIKCVYELKLLNYLGLAPDLSGCIYCQDVNNVDYISAKTGGLICPECKTPADNAKPISEPCLIAMRYITCSDDKRAFAFCATEAVTTELEAHIEAFIREHIDREFYSLQYLNMILGKTDKNLL